MFYLAHPAYHALLHMKHATNSTTKGTPYRVPSGQDPWVLPAKPDIPPMAAPPEASYRRPEDNIVLSHMPRITRDTYTKYICVHHFLIGRGTPYRVPLDARSMGSARQTGHTPHGRTSGTPSSQRMKILTKITVRQSCSRERRTLLFYLAHPAYHALLHTKHANNSPTTRDIPY